MAIERSAAATKGEAELTSRRRSPSPSPSPSPALEGRAPMVQRMCAPCQQEEEPVQRACTSCEADVSPTTIHREARIGLAGASEPLPFRDRIQASFGRHDLTPVVTTTGGAARDASDRIGASAFTSGQRIAFRDPPSLRLAAHESAHVIQQRAGLSTRDGVGARGDRWERHADRVADLVVSGRSAEPALDEVASRRPGASVQRAPSVQLEEPDRSHETKDEFAGRVKAAAQTRLTENISKLAEWHRYVNAMEGFQLRAQLLTGVATEFALAADRMQGGPRIYENWAGTEHTGWRSWEGAQLDIGANRRQRSAAFMDYLLEEGSGHFTTPSVAQRMQVLSGAITEDQLPTPVWVAGNPDFAGAAAAVRRFRNGEQGACQTCHDINAEWPNIGGGVKHGPGYDRWGLRDLSQFDTVSPIQAVLQGGAPSTARTTPPPLPTIAPQPSPQPGATGDVQANPWVPQIEVPTSLVLPPPRTALCGALPAAEDSDRVPAVESWGPNSRIVAQVVSQIGAVLLPLGPRGYRVLPRQDFDALYRVGPDQMGEVKSTILGRITERSTGYANLKTQIQGGSVPYEELCPIVDELMPSTNDLVRALARRDVQRWQSRERVLAVLELVTLGLSFFFPPLAIPLGMGLGLARMALGADQIRQGRQWQQGTGAGVYSMQQEADAPGLASRGRQNLVFGAISFATSAASFTRMVAAARAEQAFNQALLRALQGQGIIQDARFPGVYLLCNNGQLVMVARQGSQWTILGYGLFRNGRIMWSPVAGASGAAGATGAAGSALIRAPGGGSIVPFGGGGGSAMVPYGGGGTFGGPPSLPAIAPPRAPFLLGPGSSVPGLLPAPQQPFGLLPAPQQPFGLLPAPPQPFGLLPPGTSTGPSNLANWRGQPVTTFPGHQWSPVDPPMSTPPVFEPGPYTDAQRAAFLRGEGAGLRVAPHHRHQLSVQRNNGVIDEIPGPGHPGGNLHTTGQRHAGASYFRNTPGGENLRRQEIRDFWREKGGRLVRLGPDEWVDPGPLP